VAVLGAHYLKETSPEHFVESLKVDEAGRRLKEIAKKIPGK
jgi:hypothetical protein